jgi:hypothetical protein
VSHLPTFTPITIPHANIPSAHAHMAGTYPHDDCKRPVAMRVNMRISIGIGGRSCLELGVCLIYEHNIRRSPNLVKQFVEKIRRIGNSV